MPHYPAHMPRLSPSLVHKIPRTRWSNHLMSLFRRATITTMRLFLGAQFCLLSPAGNVRMRNWASCNIPDELFKHWIQCVTFFADPSRFHSRLALTLIYTQRTNYTQPSSSPTQESCNFRPFSPCSLQSSPSSLRHQPQSRP